MKLREAATPIARFLEQVRGLDHKLGPLLVQLPPSLEFDPRSADAFFGLLRELHDAAIVCEPRHASWFDGRGDQLLARHRIGRVAADPAVAENAGAPGGWSGTDSQAGAAYYRLHGSPRMYWSRYTIERLEAWAKALIEHAESSPVRCILDNTAGGAAIENAMELDRLVRERQPATGRCPRT